MIHEERQKLIDDYAFKSRAFADAVVRLRFAGADEEAFIRALADTGTAHRACEQSRIRLDRQLARALRPAVLQTS